MHTQLLIAGGGCGGTAAGIQAARLGIKTIIVEETPWLGGMITSAGVSAFDGNKYAFGGGIFQELRAFLESYYGGPEKTFTGWISLTCFEPKVAKDFLAGIAEKEKSLTMLYETKVCSVLKEGNRITGLVVKNKKGEKTEITADITIDATEFGDLIPLAGIPYRFGRDAQSDTGEEHAPAVADDIVQDLTFCAILKKFPGEAPRITPSAQYDPARFKNSTAVDADTEDESYLNHKLHDWESFISYAALPYNKYLLNWPFRSNDYPTTRDIYEEPATRDSHFKKARQLTLDYVYYMQTVLGHPEWGIAPDEFPTPDALPFIPYVRESRRIKSIRLMVEKDVVPPEGETRPPLIKDSIAVGDYFLDHHHSQAFQEPGERLEENLPDNAPFQIPIGTLIPEGYMGFLAAEKNIGVSHIVNGCTRLQPCVMLTGQAVGALAALAIKADTDPEAVPVEQVQEILLQAGCQIYPYKDLYAEDPAFIPAQQLALRGVTFREPDFSFQPDKSVTPEELKSFLPLLSLTREALPELADSATRRDVCIALYQVLSGQ